MRPLSILAAVCLALCPVASSEATILDDFNSGNIITDFRFEDPQGTQIPATQNSVPGGGSFDTDADNDEVVTNGTGQLDASGKSNSDLGTNYVDVAPIFSGRLIALFEVEWAFDEGEYNPDEDEEFRLTLINADPRSTFVTAETYFQRISATEVLLFGNAVGSPALDTPEVILGSTGSLLTLLDVDLDADTLELFYSSDGGASFLSTGLGSIEPGRGLESVRLVINEDFSDDTLLIERLAVAYVPVPEPSTMLLLAVGQALTLAVRRR